MSNRPKIKKMGEVVDRIIVLRKDLKEIEEELSELESLEFQEKKPEPKGFDYKLTILKIFDEEPDATFNTDDIVDRISADYGFTPNRNTISLRITYLTDNAQKKIERVKDKRGFYRLKKELSPPEENTANIQPIIAP